MSSDTELSRLQPTTSTTAVAEEEDYKNDVVDGLKMEKLQAAVEKMGVEGGEEEDEKEDKEDDGDEDPYTDPKSIVAPVSLKELIGRLHEVFARDHINVDYVKALMESYTSRRGDWKKFAKPDPHRYTRNLVDEGNGKFNLMVLCWNEAQGSSIHSHAGSHCFLKVLAGEVKEEMYEWPTAQLQSQHEQTGHTEIPQTDQHFTQMTVREELSYANNQCAYISDDLGLHRVENPSHSDKAVTLHLYSPPFDECLCFDERTGKPVTAQVTFWSKFGKRTPFGKDPKLASTCPKENN